MAFDLIFKDLGEIESRLFDHHPVLQGHINYFLKEFEEKRGGKEVINLKKVFEKTHDINERLLPECKQSVDLNLADIVAKVKMASQICDRISQKETELQNQFLEKQRVKRGQDWVEFMTEQYNKSGAVDREFDRKIWDAKDKYAKFGC